ncbi:hypothetical protein DEU34_0573 [Microbacterium sp. AG1240]|uniref:glycosyltransferase n=1 Tax=Microbacterium sp. AG1240 TaxID=2183992 RepID=UPI000F21BB28|nr:glycosyltransferase [Microbacterium sp. AG1240]RKT36067.1 hypothetical protein DEU34_0573 [Microbacterium sp. AG1240]
MIKSLNGYDAGLPDTPNEGAPSSVIIVEGNPTGHRLSYVSLLADAADESAMNISILTSKVARDSPEWALHLGSFEGAVELDESENLEQFARLADERAASVVVIPDGDKYLKHLFLHGWRSSSRISLLVMRPDGQASGGRLRAVGSGVLKKILILAVNLRRRVHVRALSSSLREGTRMVPSVPDPVSFAPSEIATRELRREMEAGQGEYWVAVLGLITRRKNLDAIAEAVASIPWGGLVLAGSLTADARALAEPFLRQLLAEGRLITHFGSLSDSDFDAVISAVDCVAVVHSNNGPSGVVGKAAAAGTRLILGGARSLKRDWASARQVATWSGSTPKELAYAMAKSRNVEPLPMTRPLASKSQFCEVMLLRSSKSRNEA